jgi:hypothetical protein
LSSISRWLGFSFAPPSRSTNRFMAIRFAPPSVLRRHRLPMFS